MGAVLPLTFFDTPSFCRYWLSTSCAHVYLDAEDYFFLSAGTSSSMEVRSKDEERFMAFPFETPLVGACCGRA